MFMALSLGFATHLEPPYMCPTTSIHEASKSFDGLTYLVPAFHSQAFKYHTNRPIWESCSILATSNYRHVGLK